MDLLTSVENKSLETIVESFCKEGKFGNLIRGFQKIYNVVTAEEPVWMFLDYEEEPKCHYFCGAFPTRIYKFEIVDARSYGEKAWNSLWTLSF